MKIPFLKLLVTSAAISFALAACQQPTGMQGGIVDNGNKPGGSTGPIIPLPTQKYPGGEVDGKSPNFAKIFPVLGGRHTITSLPAGFSLRQVSNDMADILDTQNEEAKAAAKLYFNQEIVCQGDGQVILETIDGGLLLNCREMLYELKASNEDRIIVSNGSLNKDVLYSILRSIRSQ
jgi:hypothetical protein